MEDLCNFYLAFLRSLYLIHQNHHWLTHGENFYGNHLLFERIYQSAQENTDLAAEKFVGLFKNCITVQRQCQYINTICLKYNQGSENFIHNSLVAEKEFLEFSDVFYKKLKAQKQMSLGLDDMIMSIASAREEAVYLLSQVNSNS